MIAFDTNYIVRLLVQDDPSQFEEVVTTMLLESENGRNIILYDIALCESLWVLSSAYGASRKELLKALEVLRNDPVFVFENSERIEAAMRQFEVGNADFADYLILETSRRSGHELKTFDKKLRKEIQTSACE